MKPQLKEVKQQGTPLRPLKLYRMQNDTGPIDVPTHWQDTVEVIWVRSGRLALRIGEASHTGLPGDVFYINPCDLHGMQSQEAGCRYLAFLFPLSWLQFTYADEAGESCLAPLAEGGARVVNRLPEAVAAAAAGLLDEIVALYESTVPGAWLGIKANVLRLYYLLHSAGLVERSPGGSRQMDTLLAIAHYIQEHYAEPLSLQVLGRQFHMSPKYFSAYFQKHFFRSFTDYLTAVRLEQAKKLLQETDADIELVAQRAGFSASSYFIRTFRQSLGMTPGQYRRALEQKG
ncbi:MAG TPA: AraC family transcriptional regulator [Candidatus Gemmiger faecigallinarum]|nr:AraC family transcriptional regulator [Candidatus Gemmiger faecigallinarum]